MDGVYSDAEKGNSGSFLTLKKLLIKINLRNELEEYRANPNLWMDAAALPMLNSFFLALRQCPLVEKILAPLEDKEQAYADLLNVLPVLARKMREASKVDILVQLVNDLGNMWTGLKFVIPEDSDMVDESVFDDIEMFNQNFGGAANEGLDEEAMYQAQFVAQSRIIRARALGAVRKAVETFEKKGEDFESVLNSFVKSPSLQEVPQELKGVLFELFSLLDLLMSRATSTDFRRDALERNANSMSSKVYGALLNATNPIKYLPTFMRYILKTKVFGRTIAEMFVLKPLEKKVVQAKKGLPEDAVKSIQAFATSDHVSCSAAKISMNDVNHMLETDSTLRVSEFLSKEACLNCLKYSALLHQKQKLMDVCKTDEFLFVLDKFSPLIGEPLDELFQAMRIGTELRKFGLIFVRIAQTSRDESKYQESLNDLHNACFLYIRDVIENDRSNVLKNLLLWLHHSIKSPQKVDLREFLSRHCDEDEIKDIWTEVARARDQLQKGGHFVQLEIPKLRDLAKHFHKEFFISKK